MAIKAASSPPREGDANGTVSVAVLTLQTDPSLSKLAKELVLGVSVSSGSASK